MSLDILSFDLELLEFIALSFLAIVLAILALEYKDIVYAAFFFGLMSSVIAGLYLLLDAPFLAMVQMAVYTGAISVLIIFGVLLIRREDDRSVGPYPSVSRSLLGILIAASISSLMVLIAIQFKWESTIPPGNYEQAKDLTVLAQEIWGRYVLPVELIGVVLLSAIVGSVALLRQEKRERMAAFHGEPILAKSEDMDS